MTLTFDIIDLETEESVPAEFGLTPEQVLTCCSLWRLVVASV